MHDTGHTFTTLAALPAAGCGLAFFGAIYLLFGSTTWFLTHHLLPALNIGHVLDPRPVHPQQLRREWRLSAASITIFGIGVLLPWGFLRLGWAQLYPDAGALRIGLEIAALMLWNDVHFWCNHRLLHTRGLMRFHRQHHRSIVTTPFATYAFHPIEAALLGTVMLPPMLMHDFSFWSLAGFSALSLAINCFGHSNYDFFPRAPYTHGLAGSRRHHLHHACFHGNYGFLFDFMDRLFGTRLPADAAHTQLQRWRNTRNTRNTQGTS